MTHAAPAIRGIDVSHLQGVIDWKSVAASLVRFAFLKCSEGATFHDAAFANYRSQAAAHGLNVGAYHFWRDNADWGLQAHSFVTGVDALRTGELPPVLDAEDRDHPGVLTVEARHDKLIAWLEAVEARLGRRPIIYCDPDYATHNLTDVRFAKYPLWLAAYQDTPPAPHGAFKHVTFWQYAEHGRCPGVHGDCDQDRFLDGEEAYRGVLTT